MKKGYLVVLAAIGIGAAAYLANIGDTMVSDVKSGKRILMCQFKDGARDVDPKQVEGIIDTRWVFKNGGSATNCVTKANTQWGN